MNVQPRPCPLCGSAAYSALLAPTGGEIFASNWTYRPQSLGRLGEDVSRTFPIVRCNSCSFAFALYLPAASFLDFIYEEAIDPAKAQEANLSRQNILAKMAYLPRLLAIAPDADPLNLLDYGCGFGPVLEALRGVPGVLATGFETSEARRESLASRGLHAVGTAGALRDRGPYHAVVLDNVLEHMPDPRAVLESLRAFCAEGTAVFVSVPDSGADKLAELATHRTAPLPMSVNPWEHLNYFDVAHLDALLAGAGFQALPAGAGGEQVDIGIRPGLAGMARVKNAAASAGRLLRHVRGLEAAPSVNHRFYRILHRS